MAGYTRQSAASIVNGSPITAPPLNAEFTQLVSALAASTGHKHDGTTAEGGYVPLIADSDAKNKIVADQTNNRFGVFVEVGTTPVEQVRFQDGAILPVTNSDIDLGGLNLEFKDLFIDGTAHIDTLDVDENATIAGTFAVTGTSIFTDAISAGSLTTTGNSIHATVDINGGAIDSTIIGASTAAAGSFTTVSTTGQASLATADINGGTIDGSVIGGATPQAVTGTIITANTGFTGALTGDVTGNLTSAGTSTFNNITATGTTTGTFVGDLTGNVTASSGTTTLNNLVVDGTVDFTSTALLNVSDPTTAQQAATKNYTDTADALKLNLAGGTMSGAVAMGTNKITGLGNPTDNQDAVSKFYADTSDALKLNLSGGTMSGAIAMGNSKITGLGTPTADTDAATKGFVDTSIANVIEAAPAALDTLNELAAALGDDANFSTTVTNSLATKLPLAGGTMTGDVTLGANKATSTATPATDDTLTRKGYVDDQDATKLALAGGTMSGDITLGSNSATSTATPTTDDTLTRKGYVDTNDALKLNLAGGTMSGAIAMGTSKITGLGDPTGNQDAATKAYTDTQDATKLNLSGGTMTGNLVLGSNKATSTATPTSTDDLTRKGYVDSILGSATSSAASAAAASTSETNAATSETNAGNSAAAAAASLDSFDDRYLGAKSSAPSTDNDGDALTTGALYWNTTSADLHIWDGSNWQQGSFTAGSLLANVLEDTTPQLGGNLDLNTNNITGTGNVGITGNITLSGTVDGRDLSVDGAKLDGIEAGADVTDTTNVVAALTAGSNITIAANGTISGAAQYTHPSHPGDDINIDTGALSGATVISDLDFNVTTDTLGHVTDANATVSTRNITLANLGYTGATNANYITNNNQLTNGAGYTTYTANQSLNTNNGPTFNDVYVNNWFRNNQSGEGMYNHATGQHWYSDHDDYWNVAGGGSANGIRFRDDHNSTVRGYVYANASNEIGFLDSDENWAIKHVRDSRTEFYINNSEKMQIDGSNLTVHHGSVVLGGTGRIQGVDTVSSGTDAANKNYVDTAVASAAPSYSATASGSIANGAPVIVNSNGTLSSVAVGLQANFVADEGATDISGGGTAFTGQYTCTYDANQKCFLATGKVSGATNYHAVVGVMNDSGQMSWGTQQDLGFATLGGYDNGSTVACFDETVGKVIIAYRNASNHLAVRPIAVDAAAKTTSAGSETVCDGTAYPAGMAMVYGSGFAGCALAYKRSTNILRMIIVKGSAGATSLGAGSPLTVESQSNSWFGLSYHPTHNRVVATYKAPYYPSVGIFSVSGYSVSKITSTQLGSGNISYYNSYIEQDSLSYDPVADKFFIAYNRDFSALRGRTFFVEANAITVGGEGTVVSGDSRAIRTVFNSVPGNVGIVYTQSNAGKFATVTINSNNTFTVNNSNLAFGSGKVVKNHDLAYDPVNNHTLLSFRDDASSAIEPNYATFKTTQNGTNLKSGNFIGISNGSYSNGQTATAQLSGSVDDAQSGLTPGSAYYVQGSGGIGTSASTPSVLAGTAVSSTKLVIK